MSQVAEVLIRLVTDENSYIRDSATRLLEHVGIANPELATAQVTEALIRLLSDEDSYVRSWATGALRRVGEGNPKLVPPVSYTHLTLPTN